MLDYVCGRWGVDEADVVRPFWPGDDFETFEYPEGYVVVENPPFSILAKIQGFNLGRGFGLLKRKRAAEHIRSTTRELFWWAQQDSNLQPGDYESLALTVAP